MREFQERRRLKKFLHSRYAIAVLSIVIVLLARGVWGIYGKYERSKGIVERANADLAALAERERTLSKSLESLNTPEGKEREIRDRFGAVKEGETLVILVDETVPNEKAGTISGEGFWSRFFGIFDF
jgi:cell division protein FtsB